MHPRGPGFDSGEGVRDIEPAVTMSVPIDTDLVRDIELGQQVFDPGDEVNHTPWHRGAHRIAQTEALGAGIDGSGEQDPQVFGRGTDRVLGDVHDLEPLTDRELDRLPAVSQNVLDIPLFGVLTDRARADEHAGLDRYAGLLYDLGDRLDVDEHRTGGAVGLDLQTGVGDLAAEALDRIALTGARSRQPHVSRFYSQAIHQVKDLDLHIGRRVDHRGALQTIPKRLVVQHGPGWRVGLFGSDRGPVVDELFFLRCGGHRLFPSNRVAEAQTALARANWRARSSSIFASASSPSLLRICARWNKLLTSPTPSSRLRWNSRAAVLRSPRRS